MPDVPMVECPACGAVNRVPQGKTLPGRQAVCGRCHKPLPGDAGTPLTVTDETFGALVDRSPLPVLVDMWAPWCGPCKMIAPAVEQLAAELAGRVRVAKVNIDENPLTTERFQIRGIPALLVLKSGRELDRMVGALPKTEIARRLENAIA